MTIKYTIYILKIYFNLILKKNIYNMKEYVIKNIFKILFIIIITIMDLNKAQVIGRITQDLELKQTPNGQSVISFSVATNRNWTDSS